MTHRDYWCPVCGGHVAVDVDANYTVTTVLVEGCTCTSTAIGLGDIAAAKSLGVAFTNEEDRIEPPEPIKKRRKNMTKAERMNLYGNNRR